MTHNDEINSTTWILLANSEKAQFYAIENKVAHLFKSVEHPESRLKSGELTSDTAGSYKTSHASRGRFVSSDNPHNDEHEIFSREINKLLENHRYKNDFHSLILCAEPHFYGLLNKHMCDQVRSSIKQTIEKDYIPLPHGKIITLLKEIVQQALGDLSG